MAQRTNCKRWRRRKIACSGLAPVTITGYAALGDPLNQPIFENEGTHQFAGDVIYTRGNHNFKVGATLIRRNVSVVQQVGNKGLIAFTGATQAAALTSFFKGAPYIYQRQAVLTKPYERTWETGVFAQDDWSVSKKLKLNLGVRYDVDTAPNDKYGNNANLDLSNFTLNVSPTAGIQTDHHDVAPRFGFAYNPMQGTVLRGGFGLSFQPSDIGPAFFLSNPPYNFSSGNVIVTTPLSTTGVAPVVASTALTGALQSKPIHFNHTYVEQYNLLLQQDFQGTVFTLGYVGESGKHLYTPVPNIDLPPPQGPVAANAPAPALLYITQLPKVNTIAEQGDFAFSKYNSLQASVERRTQNGLTINVNYTWAHGLDDVNNAVDGDAAYGLIPSKISTYDYGSSPLDVTNRFAGTFNYELPYGKNGGALRKAVFGGIQFNGLGFWQNATPFGISSTATNPLTGRTYINLPVVTTERPDVIGPVHGGGSLAQFFNIGAFARQVSVGTAGNAGRNQVRGPHQRRGDLSLLKKFKIHEGYTGEFRVECFNITNTPNFAAPNANITAYSTTPDAQGRLEATDITGITAANPNGTRTGTFGQITATTPGSSGRQFQFALRLSF